MKFIVDAQLPKVLSNYLIQKGFDSIHTLDLPDRNKTKDDQINKFAINENRIVITKDTDFLDTFLIKSTPPKLVIVKTGNIPNKALIRLFDKNLKLLIGMLKRSNLVEVTTTEIAEQG